mgnify:FL=1
MVQHSQALDLEEALSAIQQLLPEPTKQETCALQDALGRVVAQPIHAALSLPPFIASAMDGVAARSKDVDPNAPYSLHQVGTSFAGNPYLGHIEPGQCIRIFTGAAMPEGADLVIVQENIVEQCDDQITFVPHTTQETHIRDIGNDVAKGQCLAERGERISPFMLGQFAAAGISLIQVFAKVRVGIFSSGDELRDPGTPLSDLAYGQIYDSNRLTVAKLLDDLPIQCVDLGCLPDDPKKIDDALLRATDDCDVLITSGGVSVGDADYIVERIRRHGELRFWRLNLKPGKPLAFGHIHSCWIFGLPGNPISTIITALLVARPAIAHLAGTSMPIPLRIVATLKSTITHTTGRTEYQRGHFEYGIDGYTVTHTGQQGSNRLSSFRNANCLIEIAKTQGDMQVGDEVIILPLTNLLH